jgi:hypothetical protein
MSVRVVARIRPLLKLELDKDTIVTAESAGSESPGSPTVVRIPNPKNDAESFSFQFNSVYDQHATQQQIFDHEGSKAFSTSWIPTRKLIDRYSSRTNS